MDDIDLSAERTQFLLDLSISQQLARSRQARAETPPLCEDCEEHPRAILHGGARSRYCERCLQEHVQMSGRQLAFI